MHPKRRAALAALTCLAAACGEDAAGPEVATDLTHPEGVVVDSIALSGRPYGVVVLDNGTALITRRDDDRVSLIDVYDVAVTGELPTGHTPGDIVLAPDGRYAYLVNHWGRSVGRIDTETTIHESFIGIENDPVAIAVSADAARLYVTDNRHSLHVMDARTRAIRTTLEFGEALSGPALHPTAPRLYVTSRLTGEVCTVDTGSEMLLGCRDVGGKPQRQAVDPQGERLFTTSEIREVLDVWSLDEDRLLRSLPIGPCNMIVFSPDGEQIYVSQSLAYRLTVLDADDLEIVWCMETARRPRWIGFTERGDRAVVAAEGGQVYIIR